MKIKRVNNFDHIPEDFFISKIVKIKSIKKIEWIKKSQIKDKGKYIDLYA